MKKKITLRILLLSIITIFSFCSLSTTRAEKQSDTGVAFCNYWCTTGGSRCVLHVGYSGGTYDVICNGYFF